MHKFSYKTDPGCLLLKSLVFKLNMFLTELWPIWLYHAVRVLSICNT